MRYFHVVRYHGPVRTHEQQSLNAFDHIKSFLSVSVVLFYDHLLTRLIINSFIILSFLFFFKKIVQRPVTIVFRKYYAWLEVPCAHTLLVNTVCVCDLAKCRPGQAQEYHVRWLIRCVYSFSGLFSYDLEAWVATYWSCTSPSFNQLLGLLYS